MRRITWGLDNLKRQISQGIRWPKHRYETSKKHLYWKTDAKTTSNQATLEIGISTVEKINKVLAEMIKHLFLAYTFHKQTCYLYRHLIKPTSLKLRSFVSRLQELNICFGEFPLDTPGQGTKSLSTDEIIDIIYRFMPTMWKNKTIEHGFNYANSVVDKITDFFETRVENLEPREKKKNCSVSYKKKKDKKGS